MQDIRLPDGRIIKNVPNGITKSQLRAKLAKSNINLDGGNVASEPNNPRANVGERTIEGVKNFGAGIASGVENIGMGILQAATDLGYDLPGIKTVLKKAYPGISEEIESLTADDISNVISRRVSKKKKATSDEGLAFKVGQVAGEVTPFLPVGAGMSLAKGGAAAGAAIGFTTPLEESGIVERAKNTAISGAIGAGVGKGLEVAGKAVKGAANLAKNSATKVTADDVIGQRINPNQVDEALSSLKSSSDDSALLLPDVAGDEIKGLTRSVAKFNGGSKDIITDALENRSFKAVERVSNQLSKDISSVDTYFGTLDELASARGKMAAPLYDKAFKKGTKLDISKNKELFEKIAPDIKAARRNFRMGDEVADNSIVMLDAAKKNLDDNIGKAIRNGENQKAKVLTGFKKELLEKLDNLNPDYKKARQVFSDSISLENAIKQGRQFSKLKPDEIKKVMKNLTVGEKEAFRIGVRENLQDIVSKTSDGADPAKRIFGNSLKRNQIKAIFSDSKKYESFERAMKDEIKTADTFAKVLKGSRTDFNQASDAEITKGIITAGRAGLGDKTALFSAAGNWFKNKYAAGLSKKNAEEVARILMDKNKSIEALEKLVSKQSNATQKRVLNDFLEGIKLESDLFVVEGSINQLNK